MIASTPPASAAPHGNFRWAICALLFFSVIINYLDRQLLSILKKPLSDTLGWTDADYGWITAAFSFAYAFGYLLGGRFMDWFGVKRGIPLVVFLWSTAAVAHGFCAYLNADALFSLRYVWPSWAQKGFVVATLTLPMTAAGFMLARIALGITQGGIFPGAIKTVAEWFPARERALATGLFNAGTNIGAIACLLLVPWIYTQLGWEKTFYVTGVTGYVWLLAWAWLYERPERSRRVSSQELLHIRDGATTAPEKTRVPWLSLLRYRAVWAYVCAGILAGPAWGVYQSFMPDFLQKRFGLSLQETGTWSALFFAIAVAGGVLGGWLAGRLIARGWTINAARKIALLACALSVVPVFFAPFAGSVWLAVLIVGIAGSAHQGWSANLFSFVSDTMPRDAISSVVGLGGFVSYFAGGFVNGITGEILQRTGSYVPVFAYISGMYLLSLGLLHLLVPRIGRAQPPRASAPVAAPANRPEGSPVPAVWYPDCGDGSYRNPVLFADYSDPDAIRVGEDYWLVSSSFSHVPGLPILHSRDLVNWTLVNHALPRLVPEAHFAVPRHGAGVWAPALRFHAGRFWIYYADPDFGIYVVTTDNPRARWSDPVLVKAGKGLIDPCPFWDENGAGYLVHAWARSRAGIANRLTLHRLAADNRSVSDVGRVIVDGDALAGWHTLEGPKLYRRGGYYYIFAPAGGVSDGYQGVFRARQIDGPYENRIVLDRGGTAVNGPHQGAWVDTPDGSHWFLHFQEVPAFGRVVHLQPLHWRDDGWPMIGSDPDGDGKGEPVLRHAKPRLLPGAALAPATSDEFDAPQLGRQWQWQANPAPEFYSLSATSGCLRLVCAPLASKGSLWFTPQLLLQKFSGPAFVATTRLTFSTVNEGERAGLIIFGFDYAWIGLQRRGGRLDLVLTQCVGAHEAGGERELYRAPFEGDSLQLRVAVRANAACVFSWSADGARFAEMPGVFRARSSAWVGAKIGLFAGGAETQDGAARGHADFDWFRVTAS